MRKRGISFHIKHHPRGTDPRGLCILGLHSNKSQNNCLLTNSLDYVKIKIDNIIKRRKDFYYEPKIRSALHALENR